jgi:hypothetical protein
VKFARDRSGTILYLELAQDAMDVPFGGACGDEQTGGDLLVGEPHVTQEPSTMLSNSGSSRRVRVAQRIPYVVDGVLHVPEPPGGPEIAIGSPSWVA